MNNEYEKIGEVSYGFFKIFLKETAENVKKFFVKNKVGFLPEGMDYSDFQKIKTKTSFKQLKFLIGKHETLSIILVGLYIQNLDKERKSKVIEENRQKIYNKHGPKGVCILNFATTGFIEGYIKWLSDYNIKNNPSQQEIINLYERNLNDWQERTIFVQTVMQPNTIMEKIIGKMNMGKEAFFVFASKGAIKNVEEAIKNKYKENNLFLEEQGYDFSTESLNNNSEERVWIFERTIQPES